MINNFLIILCVLICINSCRMPADPLGEIKIIKRLDTIDTGGDCLDLDVNMIDSILVVAANYNGFIIYDIFDSNNELNPIKTFHVTDMAPDLGDNRIAGVRLSKEHDFMVLFDQYDKIYLAKKDGTPITYMGDGEYDCAGGAWHDVMMVDKEEEVIIFSLVNHKASEADAATEENTEYIDYSKSLVWVAYDVNDNMIGQSTGEWCEYSININYLADDISYSNAGYVIVSYGELGVRIFKQLEEDICYDHIMALSVKQDFEISSFGNTISGGSWSSNFIPETDNGVLLIIELDKIPSHISNIEITDYEGNLHVFDHDILNGDGTGNRLWVEDIGNNLYNINFSSDQTILHFKFQLDSDIISIHSDFYEPITAFSTQNDYNTDLKNCENRDFDTPPGLGGTFEPEGGLNPNIFTQFDTQGEVEFVFAESNTVFAGLRSSNGCIMAQLDDDGNIMNTYQFAIGYTMKGMHQDDGLLAIAAGYDGILLYNWSGPDVSFLGKIETSYANNVKVAGNIIFAATEYGIEIIQIDY